MKIDPAFLEPEVRCGYEVSTQIKHIWTVQLDLLDRFAQVCESNGLQYFLDGGTLLGAVRHKGFIPWDDDVDVIMPRRDYEKLCAIATDVFQKPYFFQTTLTDPGILRAHAQLRNSNTTGYIMPDKNRSMNKGIFLDIFVLDAIPDGFLARKQLKNAVNLGLWLFWLTEPTTTKRRHSLRAVLHEVAHTLISKIPTSMLYRVFEQKVLARYSQQNTKLVGDMTLGWHENVHWDRVCFSDYLILPFENLNLRVPVGYDAILTKQYGDYKTLPVPSQRGQNQHGSVFWDPHKPYTYYFTEKKD